MLSRMDLWRSNGYEGGELGFRLATGQQFRLFVTLPAGNVSTISVTSTMLVATLLLRLSSSALASQGRGKVL
jgi:hypothetical protein